MSGTVVSPIISDLKNHFSTVPQQLVIMVMTLPSLLIISFSFLTAFLAKKFTKKKLVLIGLSGYVIGGISSIFLNNLFIILLFRALLGASVGILSPLSNGLIADYFFGKERTEMMGYSAASNNLGAAISTILAGFLANIYWRYVFYIYLVGIIVFLLVLFLLPEEVPNLSPESERKKPPKHSQTQQGMKKWGFFTFLVIIVFFSIPTHLDIFIFEKDLGTSATTGSLMGLLTLVSFFTGIFFQKLVQLFKDKITITGFVLLLICFILLSLFSNLMVIIIAITLAGLAMGILIPLIMDSITKEVHSKDVVLSLAVINLSLYLGQFISPLIPGGIAGILQVEFTGFPFQVSAFLALVSIVSLLLSRKINFSPIAYQ